LVVLRCPTQGVNSSRGMVATARKLSEGEHHGIWLRFEKILIFSKSMVRPWSEDGRDYA
jgi:hypothetical protein